MLLTFEGLLRGRPKRITNPNFGWRVRKQIYCQQPDDTTIIVRWLENPGAPHEAWTFTDVLRVTPNEISAVQRHVPMYARIVDFLGVTVSKKRDRSTDGVVFAWICPRTHKWKEKIGKFPIHIRDNELHVSPAGVRTVNEVKRRAFNAKLKEVRNFFRVRAKLGVFNNISVKDLRRNYYALRQEKSFVDVLNDVRVNDLDSFKPLLSWMFRYWWNADSLVVGDTSLDLLERFNSVVDAERERCKLELGAVTYEVPEADIISLPHTTGTPHDQCVELLATRDIRAV